MELKIRKINVWKWLIIEHKKQSGVMWKGAIQRRTENRIERMEKPPALTLEHTDHSGKQPAIKDSPAVLSQTVRQVGENFSVLQVTSNHLIVGIQKALEQPWAVEQLGVLEKLPSKIRRNQFFFLGIQVFLPLLCLSSNELLLIATVSWESYLTTIRTPEFKRSRCDS